MPNEVAIVGAGPAGSTAAMLLAKDHDVILFEEHEIPGHPVQCAGLVTPRAVPHFARESVLAEMRGARIHSPLGYTMTVRGRETKALVLDRAKYDSLLFDKATDAGAVPHLGTKVVSILQRRGSVKLGIREGSSATDLDCKVVVGADGYRSVCRRAARLPGPKHMLRGVQVDLKGVEIEPDLVEIYTGHSVAPGFFAWAIPAGELVRIGLCTWRSEFPPATYLRKLLSRPEFAKGKRISTASGQIPVGPMSSAVSGSILLVGDAACHAKPLSGGGIYTGTKGAELASGVVGEYLDSHGISSLDEYDPLWKAEFGRELSRAFRIRKIFLELSDKKMDKALRIFDGPEVRALIEERGDIDYPASLSSPVLKMAPKLAQFSPQLIKSLL